MLLDPSLINEDFVTIVEDVDGVIAHDKIGSLFLLKQQGLVFVTFGRGTLLLFRINLIN